MTKRNYSRREFVKRNSLAGLGAATAGFSTSIFANNPDANIPAILGGKPVRTAGWPGWPLWNPKTDEELLMNVIRSGVWSRKNVVSEFEQKWAEINGARRCCTKFRLPLASSLSKSSTA